MTYAPHFISTVVIVGMLSAFMSPTFGFINTIISKMGGETICFFGEAEYFRHIGCEPYICTNAGTGTPEEMSDWVEYCNLDHEGEFAKWRIANGYPQPHRVRYWSIGNENYSFWELGAKQAGEWGRRGGEQVALTEGAWQPVKKQVKVTLQPHSVNVIQIR